MTGPQGMNGQDGMERNGAATPSGRPPAGSHTHPQIILAPPRVPTRPRRTRQLVWSLSILGATMAAVMLGRLSRSPAPRPAAPPIGPATSADSAPRANDATTTRAVVELRDGRVIHIEKRPYDGPRTERDTTSSRAASGERTVSWRRGGFLYTVRGSMSIDSLLRLGGRALP